MFTDMADSKRPYRKKARAEAEEATRQKIVEATVRLHEKIGPRATTISAIAKEAGVQRLTVYRHFPDETAVFQACTSHWLEQNPPPDPTDWSTNGDPEDRARCAIAAFYDYFARTRRMWTVSFRDVEEVPALQEPMATFAEFVRRTATDLARDLESGDGPGAATATIRHALHFPTWRELDDQGLAEPAKVDLILAWLRGAVRGASVPRAQGGMAVQQQDPQDETG